MKRTAKEIYFSFQVLYAESRYSSFLEEVEEKNENDTKARLRTLPSVYARKD